MKTKTFGMLWLLLIINFISSNHAQACSSFMLRFETKQIFGHNLDIGGQMPGMVFVNKRDITKQGYTWEQLTSINPKMTSNISWISKYGSITFNAFGRDLPDGGMNEKGLFIWEMTGISSFDTIESRPRIFMAQWMQYQLDNFASVNEVLQNISSLGLDGWNWHFFIADKEGRSAGIEFIEGTVIINTKDNMPLPLMGNGRYSDDLSFIKEFKDFGGSIQADISDPHLPGIVKAAKMMKNFKDTDNIVDHGFNILGQLSRNPKWSVIFDVNEMQVHFKTAAFKSIKSFAISSFDFSSNSPVKILNIQDEKLSGNVEASFKDFNEEDHTSLVKELVTKLYSADEFELSEELLVNKLSSAYKITDQKTSLNIEGSWKGYAEYPTTGKPAKVDWEFTIKSEDGVFTGKITDSAGLLKDTEMKNIAFDNGLFKFTVYSHGYVFKISSTLSGENICGIFDISDESRKGRFSVQKE